jgi:hypothetical protein
MANPAINVALLAAAAQQHQSSDDLTKQLRAKGATSPRSPAALDLSASGAKSTLQSLIKQGYIREAGDGRYWLDEEQFARSKAAAGRFFLILLAFLLSAGASVLALASAG